MRQPTGRPVAATATALLIAVLAAGCAGEASPSVSTPPSERPAAATPPGPTSSRPPRDGSFHVRLTTASGGDLTIDVGDASGTLVAAVSGDPGDGASVEAGTVVVTNDDPSTLRLTWSGGPCDAGDTLTIDDTGRRWLLLEPECGGDAVAFDRILVLRFLEPIDHSAVLAILQDGIDT